MKKPIFYKVFSGYVFIVLLLSILIIIFSFRMIKDYYINTITDELKNLGNALKPEVTAYLEEKRLKELDNVVKDLGRKINTRITVVDPQGLVVADSQKDPKLMESHKNRPEIIQAFKGQVDTFLRYSTTVKEDMLYVALPVETQEKVIGVLRLSLFLKDLNDLLDHLKESIIKCAVLIIVICLLGAFIFSKSLTKPIKKLSVAFQRVASGDFNTKLLLKNKDEVKELADSFNMMTEQIKTLFAELSHQKDSLKGIISSIQAGLIVLDKKDSIILSNESFKKISHHDLVEGKFYWECIRETRFGEMIKKVRDEGQNFIEEVAIHDRIYLCSATFMRSREEIVVILHDITDMKNIEKIKRDFVVNVSHELRTPLTAIKGFVETLEEEIGEKGREYVEVIKKNTDRLINIVQDLLLLSELEEKGSKLEREEVSLRAVIGHVIRIFKQRLSNKNLDLKVNIEGELPLIKADPFKLEQMFINLLDNSINYTEKGQVALSLKQKNEKVEISIEDTGIGIPPENLPRIFERFYVVDKSRSKKLGGTGLGLSIVKHIVLSHKGTIEVESTLGKGTKFIITLPH